ncbi:MAG: hypothetical protein HQK62_03705 [Desulfamplus sp.]|nr:hypothetical protein [Desulfamplus sp.]
MLTGIQEILTIGFIIVCLFFIPRLFRNTQPRYLKKARIDSKISGKMRLGIVLSVILPLSAAFILRPWEGNFILFLSVAILPIAVGWAGVWVINGFKNKDSIY